MIFRRLLQMIKMLIVVVACFSICWFPHEVYWVLKFPFPQLSTFPADPYIFTVFHMLALSHACFNPIICCWMNSSVRHGFMCTFGKYLIIEICGSIERLLLFKTEVFTSMSITTQNIF